MENIPKKSNDKKWYEKWWFWLLIVIFVIFVIPIVINFCYTTVDFWPTDWNGGDLLQFYGAILASVSTIFLGKLALNQNKRANDLAELFGKNNQELLKLQAYEYKPKLFIDSFIGISKFSLNDLTDKKLCNEIILFEGHTADNEVFLGYALNLCMDNINNISNTYCRTYELDFKYYGKMSVQEIMFESISFYNDEEIVYDFPLLKGALKISLNDGDNIKLLINIISCENFLEKNTPSNRIINCNKMILKYRLIMMDNSVIYAQNCIIKKIVKDPGKTVNSKNVELSLSSTYKTD